MARWAYRYAPILHRWNGSERYVGVAVHAPETGFFRVALLGRGDLVRRLWDVPRAEIERLSGLVDRLEETGQAHAGEVAWLERISSRGAGMVRVGTVHDGTAPSLPWAVACHFEEYAHPQIADIG